MADGGYRILQPGPIVPDELRGDIDLFEAHNLSRIANAVLSGALKHGDYLRGMGGATEFRKGPGMLLAPLAAAGLSADATFEFKPLSRALLDQGCSLEPGVFELAEADKGIPVSSAMAAPSGSAGAGLTGDSVGRRDRRREKKRKRDGEAEA
ncbi:hypothetical protein ACKKBG_A21970 [Auxenochlorella protothecoides x Auxenochlorella symbiontica]